MDVKAAKATSGGEDCGSLERPTDRNEHHGVSFFFIPYICVLSHHHSESDEHVSSPFKSAPADLLKHFTAREIITTYITIMAAVTIIPMLVRVHVKVLLDQIMQIYIHVQQKSVTILIRTSDLYSLSYVHVLNIL